MATYLHSVFREVACRIVFFALGASKMVRRHTKGQYDSPFLAVGSRWYVLLYGFAEGPIEHPFIENKTSSLGRV